ncbi:MAG: hypothetical protein LBJ72_08945 [Dysgonamonadaceae bacterium]|jgi:hypothetical protein|nr:hypothetical protein [Dysgonamonadaceae bacterium]
MTDTLNPQKLTKELMYLQISEEISKYMNYSIFHRDSLITDDRKKGNNVDVIDAVKNGRYQSSATDQNLSHLFLLGSYSQYSIR